MQIYVDTDDDLRLSRRILRDIEARGRDLQGVIAQYTRFVKPAQDRFVTPSRRIADVIIPWHECAPPYFTPSSPQEHAPATPAAAFIPHCRSDLLSHSTPTTTTLGCCKHRSPRALTQDCRTQC